MDGHTTCVLLLSFEPCPSGYNSTGRVKIELMAGDVDHSPL